MRSADIPLFAFSVRRKHDRAFPRPHQNSHSAHSFLQGCFLEIRSKCPIISTYFVRLLVNCKLKYYPLSMPRGHPLTKFRSGCPLNASVEILGDRWSLLIIRDMMLRGFRSYTQF